MATLWKHPNGKYYARWMEGRKNRRKSLKTDDETIAKKRFRNFQRDLIAGRVVPMPEQIRRSFNKFCKEFLKHIEAKTAPETYRLYKDALNKAKASWGDIPTFSIKERHIDTVITDMLKSGLKATTVNKNYRHLKAALKKAIVWDYMKPLKEWPKMLKEEEQNRFVEQRHLPKLIDQIDDMEFLDFCLLSGATGLRSGELIRLKWTDVDNPEDFLRISPKQKNKKEARIPINKVARPILDRCKKRGLEKVFRFKNLTGISQKFRKYADDAGLPQYRFHDMRHTFASYLAMKGKDVKVIQELMRHKSITSTLIYTKLSPEHLKEASDSFSFGPLPVKNTGK